MPHPQQVLQSSLCPVTRAKGPGEDTVGALGPLLQPLADTSGWALVLWGPGRRAWSPGCCWVSWRRGPDQPSSQLCRCPVAGTLAPRAA